MSSEYKTDQAVLKGERSRWHTPCYGEVWKYGEIWLSGCPMCGSAAMLLEHAVTTENDKVTIIPSITCPYCKAHYWITNGQILKA